jgi:hypothetical protein
MVMSWITENKGLGPWTFAAQPDKWGYLNNPRWQTAQQARHCPCGHWHKGGYPGVGTYNIGPYWWYQQGADVNGDLIGLVPMYMDASQQDCLVSLIYDIPTNAWVTRGHSSPVQSIYAAPNTCRITPNYLAYFMTANTYYDWYGPGDGNVHYNRIYIWPKDGTPFYTDVWKSHWTSLDPYKTFQDIYWNRMDCYGNTISCLAFVAGEAGVPKYCYQIKTSIDAGQSFPTAYDLPSAAVPVSGDSIDQAQIRVDVYGNIYVGYRSSNASIPKTEVEFWKSTNNGVSFTKIWSTDYSAALGDRAGGMSFNISEDGTRITLTLADYQAPNYKLLTYYSTNGGTTFNSNLYSTATYAFGGICVANLSGSNQIMVLPASEVGIGNYGFLRSTNFGSTFSKVNPGLYWNTLSYVDMQCYNNKMVYTECGKSFIDGSNYMGIAYSEDSGLTWSVIVSPASLITASQQVVTWNGATNTGTEPQIWTPVT